MVNIMRRKTKRTIIICVVAIVSLYILLNPYTVLGVGRYRIGRLSVKLPRGYEITEISNVKVALCPEYPNNGANITFVKDKRSSRNLYSESSLYDYYSSNVNGFIGISKYEEIKIEYKDAIKLRCSVRVNNVYIEQIQIIIFDYFATYVLTFTITDDVYEEIFSEVIDSIKLGIFKQKNKDRSNL